MRVSTLSSAGGSSPPFLGALSAALFASAVPPALTRAVGSVTRELVQRFPLTASGTSLALHPLLSRNHHRDSIISSRNSLEEPQGAVGFDFGNAPYPRPRGRA